MPWQLKPRKPLRSRARSRGAASVQILLVTVMVIGLIVAIFIGQTVAHENFKAIAIIAAVSLAVLIGLWMRTKIWLLIPFTWLLGGKIGVLPVPLTVHDIGILLAFGMFLFFYAFKMVPPLARMNRYDILLGINLAYLASVYVRNPVGMVAFQSEMIGGRPYIDVAVAMLAYWVIQHITLTVAEGRLLPILTALGSTFVSGLGMATIRFPGLVPHIYPYYSGVEVGAYLQDEQQEDTTNYRLTPLSSYSLAMGGAAVAYFRPEDLLLFRRPSHPSFWMVFRTFQAFISIGLLAVLFVWDGGAGSVHILGTVIFIFIMLLYVLFPWSVIYYSALFTGLMSGFRSGFVLFAILTIASSYFRGGFAALVRIGVALVVGVTLVILVQVSGGSVPPGIQRALSFIPGPWDPTIVSAADYSTEWRVEMWKIALEGDKYIKNKVWGDGFGYRMSEYLLQQNNMMGTGSGFIGGNTAESFLVSGAFHSGPISSIRVVGVVGLVPFTALLIALAMYAWKVVWRAKGTPFFPLAIFVATPALYKPIEFWFVFGGLDNDYPKAIFSLAMLNLTTRALARYRSEEEIHSPQQNPVMGNSQNEGNRPADPAEQAPKGTLPAISSAAITLSTLYS